MLETCAWLVRGLRVRAPLGISGVMEDWSIGVLEFVGESPDEKPASGEV